MPQTKNKRSIVFPEQRQRQISKIESTLMKDVVDSSKHRSEEKKKNVFKSLAVTMYIKRFISRANSSKRYSKLIKPYHLNIINDESTLEAFK